MSQPTDSPSGPGNSTPPEIVPPTSGKPSPGLGPMTMRGVIQEGVERGCILLAAENGQLYLLLSGDRSLMTAERRVEVSGSVKTGIVTTCQQGTPFAVTSIRAI